MKKILITIIILVVILLLILLFLFLQPVKVPVLTYHDFSYEESSDMVINQEEFEKEMKYLANHHYHSLDLSEMECFMKKKCSIPKKSVLITMDDGWINELEIAAPILKKYNLKAVIFYIGEHLDDENPNFMHREDLERLKLEYPNIEIASHSYSLHFEDAYQLSFDEFIVDMDLMKEEIPSSYYAYPYGRGSDTYSEALEKSGYKLAFTFGPDKEHRKASQQDSIYRVPRLNMSNGMPFWKFVLRLHWYR